MNIVNISINESKENTFLEIMKQKEKNEQNLNRKHI